MTKAKATRTKTVKSKSAAKTLKRGTPAKATTTTKKPKGVELEIPALLLKKIKIKIKGTTPLLMHKFDKKTQIMMEDAQQGKAKNKKAPRNPKAEYEAAIHYMPGSGNRKYGFPACGFKSTAISACRFVDGITMTAAKGSFHVLGDFVEIKIKGKPTLRTDMVRIGGFGSKIATARYRPEFKNWTCELTIQYNASVISPEQIAHLYNVAGFSVGIGEWRPEKDGSLGMFEVG